MSRSTLWTPTGPNPSDPGPLGRQCRQTMVRSELATESPERLNPVSVGAYAAGHALTPTPAEDMPCHLIRREFRVLDLVLGFLFVRILELEGGKGEKFFHF